TQSIAEAVKKGEVDAGFVNSGYGYIAQQMGLQVAFTVGEYESLFPCCRQTTSHATLTDKRDALVKFQIANLRAYLTYLHDHDLTIKTLANYSGQDADYVEAVIYHGAMIVSLDPNRNKVLDFYQVMKDNGDINAATKYDMNDQIDITIYEDALNEMLSRQPDHPDLQQLMKEFVMNNR
ncbi:MAG: hypothetical protein RR051_04795, partial [Clostridiales bacterium]